MEKLRKVNDHLYEIPREGAMKVPGRIYASEKLMEHIRSEDSLTQVANVAQLPGIVGYSFAMPDIHSGYGFSIGGVAAMDAADGVISPGGVGYDINCGVRLARTGSSLSDVKEHVPDIIAAMYHTIPTGVGSHGAIPRLAKGSWKGFCPRAPPGPWGTVTARVRTWNSPRKAAPSGRRTPMPSRSEPMNGGATSSDSGERESFCGVTGGGGNFPPRRRLGASGWLKGRLR